MNIKSIKEIIISSFIIFTLFIGAGNVIFPPIVGFRYYDNILPSALGFIITAVGLPIFSLISLAYSGGNFYSFSKPIGKFYGTILLITCHLIVGPLFAVPRTSNISFAVGISLFFEENGLNLFIYNIFYFSFVMFISFYPKYLFDTIGKIFSPIKIIFLLMLGISVFLKSVKFTRYSILKNFFDFSFTNGFTNGYLTMDTFGAIAFGNIVINSIKSRKIENCYIFKHILYSCLFASFGLISVYLVLFKLGSDTRFLISEAKNGIEVLTKYIHIHFYKLGDIFLSIFMIITCFVTAVGLICSCANFFEKITYIKYKKLVLFFGLLSMIISNLGLNYLVKFSIPILTIIYPPCIVLISIHFIIKWWNRQYILVIPSILVSFIFGLLDAINLVFDSKNTIHLMSHFPFNKEKLSWLIPTVTVITLSKIFDKVTQARDEKDII